MASLNKVMFIGNLTRDVETRTFSNGGKVAMFGMAVNDRRKNGQTGQWEDDPMFVDVEVYNRGENGKLADLAEKYLQKGRLVYLEGKLKLEQWEDKNGGGRRSKHKLIVDQLQFLSGANDNNSETATQDGAPAADKPKRGRKKANPPADGGFDGVVPPNSQDEIPF